MDDRQREQVQLIAGHQLSLAKREIKMRISAVYADHAAKGRLHSSATIKVAVNALGEIADGILSSTASQVRVVSVSPAAFEIIAATVTECLDACVAEMPNIIFMASGTAYQPGMESVRNAAMGRFNEMRSDVEAKLAIQSFDFRESAPSPPTALSPQLTLTKGGNPGHEFWDDMWAAIAFALYDGALTPKSQADVERAMIEWIEGKGRSAAESTVRKRARLIWDRIAQANT